MAIERLSVVHAYNQRQYYFLGGNNPGIPIAEDRFADLTPYFQMRSF